MSMLLAISFCSILTCEEYQIDHNLTRSDCTERLQEERKYLTYASTHSLLEEAYQSYMSSFKAEHMDENGGKTPVVDWEINCVPE